jgi:putative exporter of polyketide antibiotics
LTRFQVLSPFYLYIDHDPLRNGFSVPHLLVLIAISTVAVTLAVVTFDRRDLAS